MSHPDDRASGEEMRVSSHDDALEEYHERESLDEVLTAWRAETPVPVDIRQQVVAELDEVGLKSSAATGRAVT